MQVPTPAAAMAIRDSLEEEVLIALVRAAWLAAERSNAVTAAAGLSPSQYNVLRILRAAGRGGLSCTELGARMATPPPRAEGAAGIVLRRREIGRAHV